MFETYFGFKKLPFSDEPDAKQLFEHAGWKQVQARLKFLIDHRGAGLLTGEVGSGKSTAARTWLSGLNPNLFKVIYLHWSSGSSLDLLRQIARGLRRLSALAQKAKCRGCSGKSATPAKSGPRSSPR